jgi:hypothetical protein
MDAFDIAAAIILTISIVTVLFACGLWVHEHLTQHADDDRDAYLAGQDPHDHKEPTQ